MSFTRPAWWPVLAAAVLLSAGRARAAVDEGAVVSLRVVAPAAEAHATREVLADLLSRIGVGIADAASVAQPSLVDVEIDLTAGHGGPFVALSTREPVAIICRRFLNPQASREVLIESAAEVAYAAVESRARARGVLRAAAAAPAAAPRQAEPPPGPPPVAAEIAAGAAGDAEPIPHAGDGRGIRAGLRSRRRRLRGDAAPGRGHGRSNGGRRRRR